jgi:hypothetical protein
MVASLSQMYPLIHQDMSFDIIESPFAIAYTQCNTTELSLPIRFQFVKQLTHGQIGSEIIEILRVAIMKQIVCHFLLHDCYCKQTRYWQLLPTPVLNPIDEHTRSVFIYITIICEPSPKGLC